MTTAIQIVTKRAEADIAAGKQISFAEGFVLSEDATLEQYAYWFQPLEGNSVEAAREYIAGTCLSIEECVTLFRSGDPYPRSIIYTLVDAIQTGTLVVMYPTAEYHELRDQILEAV